MARNVFCYSMLTISAILFLTMPKTLAQEPRPDRPPSFTFIATCTSIDPAPRKFPQPCSPGGTPYFMFDGLTYLTRKYWVDMKSTYGFWFDWECKNSAFLDVGKGGQFYETGQRNDKACYRPLRTDPTKWQFPKNCPTATSTKDLSCPGEPGCIGLQCFGTMWTMGMGYEGMFRGWADCVHNPIACKAPYRGYLHPPSGYLGPYMPPNVKDPEPPYPKPWPTGLGPLPYLEYAGGVQG